jgi:hypothetical protein
VSQATSNVIKIAAMVRARSDESGRVFTEAFARGVLSEFAGMRDSVRNKYIFERARRAVRGIVAISAWPIASLACRFPEI